MAYDPYRMTGPPSSGTGTTDDVMQEINAALGGGGEQRWYSSDQGWNQDQYDYPPMMASPHAPINPLPASMMASGSRLPTFQPEPPYMPDDYIYQEEQPYEEEQAGTGYLMESDPYGNYQVQRQNARGESSLMR